MPSTVWYRLVISIWYVICSPHRPVSEPEQGHAGTVESAWDTCTIWWRDCLSSALYAVQPSEHCQVCGWGSVPQAGSPQHSLLEGRRPETNMSGAISAGSTDCELLFSEGWLHALSSVQPAQVRPLPKHTAHKL